MAYKKLSEATLIESVTEEANVLVEENDEIKRVPVSGMGFSAGGGENKKIYVLEVDESSETLNYDSDIFTLKPHELLHNTVLYIKNLTNGDRNRYCIHDTLTEAEENVYALAGGMATFIVDYNNKTVELD